MTSIQVDDPSELPVMSSSSGSSISQEYMVAVSVAAAVVFIGIFVFAFYQYSLRQRKDGQRKEEILGSRLKKRRLAVILPQGTFIRPNDGLASRSISVGSSSSSSIFTVSSIASDELRLAYMEHAVSVKYNKQPGLELQPQLVHNIKNIHTIAAPICSDSEDGSVSDESVSLSSDSSPGGDDNNV
jgi:hypothetical protein